MAINVERSITVTRGTTPPPPTGVVRPRLDSIDLLRGLVIVLMALDHVRDFLCNEKIDPTDLSRASAALFLTRWVTHFCAPVFVFLAGTAAFLFGSRGKTARELSWFLLMRGLWLVFLELVYVRLMWTFNLHVWHQGPGVLWAIGWSMVVLSALVYLPVSAVATFGVLLIAVHNQFDALKAADLGRLGWLWGIVHSAEAVNWIIPEGGWLPQWRVLPPQAALPGASHPGLIVATGYGLIPWAGVMAAGYGLGALYFLDRPVRRRQLWGLGLMLTLAFVFLRATGIYFGVHFDPIPWSSWPQFWQTALEFLNCNKYPPSLLYLLMTLGPAIAALAAFDRPAGWLGRFFVVFGRVPLFFYLLHLPVIHGLGIGLAYWRHGSVDPWWFNYPWGGAPEAEGFSLPMIYLLWLGVVLFLFPLCWWFGNFKRRRRDAWLSYL